MNCSRLLYSCATLLLGLWVTGATARAATSNAPAGAATNTAALKGTNTPPVEMPIPKSVFTSYAEGNGKDPFFPDSTRFRPRDSGKTNVVAAPPEVKINGFSGTATKPYVIINNATFEVGDSMSVPTPSGRVQVRCIEIRVSAQSAIVDVNGIRQELRFPNKK